MTSEKARLDLAVRAGRVSEKRGWNNSVLVDIQELSQEGPVGLPILVLAHATLTSQQARVIAGLVGAGRPVALVCDQVVPEDVMAWLPPGVLDDSATTDGHDSPASADGSGFLSAINEPDLAMFPSLRGTALGTLLHHSAEADGVTIHFPDEDPRCALSFWDTAGGLKPAIWMFADPVASGGGQPRFLVETTIGFDPDPEWVSGTPGVAPMSVYLYTLLTHSERLKSTPPGVATILTTWRPPTGPPWPDEEFLRGSLWSVLGPRRVALRSPDGTNAGPPAAHQEALWVGYEVSPMDTGTVPLRAAMEQLIVFIDLALSDQVVAQYLQVDWN